VVRRAAYAGAIYHLMNRGDRREPIFRDDLDRRTFLRTLHEAWAKTGWQIHAYCLMANHFHFVAGTSQPNPVAGMKWLPGTDTGRCNRRHRYFGHVFSGRYKSLVIDGRSPGYLRAACDDVHLDPVRAGLVAALRRGWRLGAADFVEGLAEKLGRRGKAHELASPRGETDRERAERIVGEGLEAPGWSEAELRRQAKAHRQKVKLAWALGQQTPVTRAWIARRLAMGSASYVSYLLARSARRSDSSDRLVQRDCAWCMRVIARPSDARFDRNGRRPIARGCAAGGGCGFPGRGCRVSCSSTGPSGG
jgi:REP element-mobilizing transposase RayT